MGVSASAVIDKLLKNRYRGDRLDAVMRNTFIGWKLCEPQKRPFSGRQEIFPVQLGWGGQVAARPEMGSGASGGNSDCSGSPLPAPPVVENGAVDIKQMFGTLMWTKQAILRCADDAGAYKRLVNFELQNMQDRFLKELNFGFFGDGRGRRAQIAADASQAGTSPVVLTAAADTALVLDTNRYLAPNDLISIWNSTDTTASSARIMNSNGAEMAEGDLYIKSVSDDGVTVTIHNGNAYNLTTAASQYIRFWGESDIQSGTIRTDHVITGISAAIDDGTLATTYAGISRTTYSQWKSFVKDASSVVMSEDIVIKCADAVNRKSGRKDRKIDTLLMDPSLRRDYVKLSRPDRRYEGVDDHDVGYNDTLVMTVGPQRFKIMEDFDCPFGKIFGLNRKDLECYIAQGVEIEQDAGGTMLKMGVPYGKGGTGHVYWALVSWYGNFAMLRPFAAFLLKNLSYELETA
jgi:hypothetical protein